MVQICVHTKKPHLDFGFDFVVEWPHTRQVHDEAYHPLKEKWCIQCQVTHRGINDTKVAREAAKAMGENPTKGELTAFNPTVVMLMRVDTPRICN